MVVGWVAPKDPLWSKPLVRAAQAGRGTLWDPLGPTRGDWAIKEGGGAGGLVASGKGKARRYSVRRDR